MAYKPEMVWTTVGRMYPVWHEGKIVLLVKTMFMQAMLQDQVDRGVLEVGDDNE